MTGFHHTMDMQTAILLTIEGAAGILSFWRSKEKVKTDTLNRIQKLRNEFNETLENDLIGDVNENAQLETFVSRIEDLNKEVFGEAVTLELPYVAKPKAERSGFFSSETLSPEEAFNENIRRQVALRELRKRIQREIAKLEVPVQEEAEELRAILRERETNIKKGQETFYGSLEVESSSSGVSIEAASTCADVLELARASDPSGAMACIALSGLLRWARENEIATDPTKDKMALWSRVKDWETFVPSAATLSMLSGTWDDLTEVDILANIAADTWHEKCMSAIDRLRELLCVDPSSIPYNMRAHVRRALVKEYNKRAQAHNNDLRDFQQGKISFNIAFTFGEKIVLTEDGVWPPIKNVRILRCLLHLLRNALTPYFKAKQALEVHEASPLHLFRRQAIVDIGEMASHGHRLATDYLLDELCSSKDYSIRQIALGRAARVLPGANEKDRVDITLKLLSAALSTVEYGVVQETAETAMISALKAGLNKKSEFVEILNKVANNLLVGFDRSSPTYAAWNRIQEQGFQGMVKPRAKKAGASRNDMRSLRAGYMEQSMISN